MVVVGKKVHASPNDRVYTRVVDIASDTKFLCVVWDDPNDSDNEPVVTLSGPHLTDAEQRQRWPPGSW
jgi:hypothetical protein